MYKSSNLTVLPGKSLTIPIVGSDSSAPMRLEWDWSCTDDEGNGIDIGFSCNINDKDAEGRSVVGPARHVENTGSKHLNGTDVPRPLLAVEFDNRCVRPNCTGRACA